VLSRSTSRVDLLRNASRKASRIGEGDVDLGSPSYRCPAGSDFEPKQAVPNMKKLSKSKKLSDAAKAASS
jgi:hypothetical protein